MTLGELATLLNADLVGDASKKILRIASLANATADELSFLANRRYRSQLAQTQAGGVLLQREYAAECPVAALICDDAYVAYALAAQALNPTPQVEPYRHPGAVIDAAATVHASCNVAAAAAVEAGAVLHQGVALGANCVVMTGVVVGRDSVIGANVTLCKGVQIGERALLHPGVVIGADGFGIAQTEQGWLKVPQVGTVKIGNDVEVGANTTIDRGALEDTVIGNGVKLDNLIQIGHNVRIGDHTAIAACVAIGGSARIGARCTVAGAAAIAGHLEIVDDVHLTATSAVPNSITEPGVYSSGMPIQENRLWRRNVVRIRQLDDMAKRLRRLEKQLSSSQGLGDSTADGQNS
jgi:UDP-3-O-[3-hydroxymyristoyl] glucosamine N-acyltransferase